MPERRSEHWRITTVFVSTPYKTAEFGGNRFECRPEAGWDIMRGKHGGIYTCTASNMLCRQWHMATWLHRLHRCAHALNAGGTLVSVYPSQCPQLLSWISWLILVEVHWSHWCAILQMMGESLQGTAFRCCSLHGAASNENVSELFMLIAAE